MDTLTPPPVRYTTNPHGFNRDAGPPGFTLPRRSCDSHMHIVGPFDRYPLIETRSMQPREATLADYRRVMQATGIERAVIVQPSWYAKDCNCTLDAAEALGDAARAVVVVDVDVTEAVLAGYHARGARGVRLQNQVAGGTSTAQLLEIAARIQTFGWHVQVFIDTAEIPALAPLIRRSPVPVVIDHMAHLRGGDDTDSAGFTELLRLLGEGRVWVKLSNTRFFPDQGRMRALIEANPEHLLWGTDWPHVAFEGETPTLARLLDGLAACASDENVLEAILVKNPSLLYFNGS